jgi:plastocyanin
MATITVSAQDDRFEPRDVEVNVGDTVEWKRVGNHAHTVTADNGDFDSGNLAPNQTFTQTFHAAGVVPYHCENHSGMTGTVTVKVIKKISIRDNRFDPQNIDTKVGDTVEWTNAGTHTHTVTADDGAFDSGNLAPTRTFTQKFEIAGVVHYHCEIHDGMVGTVTVT